ncbi:MAG: rhodanese-like domain-containing protein [Paludibacteraceae bacterium]|nr:rhodanese-like domain-containing protein [Paludibacteraceae bacterium]
MKKVFISISTLLFAACAPKFPTLTPDEFEKVIAGPDVQLVDVRTPEEYDQGYIAGAMNIDWRSERFADDAVRMLDPSKPVAIYCKAGRRSHAAAGKLYKMGYRHIVELEGGFDAWQAAGKTSQADMYACDEFLTPNGKTVRIRPYE